MDAKLRVGKPFMFRESVGWVGDKNGAQPKITTGVSHEIMA
ncbi:hypothetical protein ACLWBD_15695 [Bdellovibrio sp. HCB117]